MEFRTYPYRRTPKVGVGAALEENSWDDFSFRTTFQATLFDHDGQRHEIGTVKIGQIGMESGGEPAVPRAFEQLNGDFFSVGQDADYYENLNSLGPELRDAYLIGMRDVAADPKLFDRVKDEEVMTTSLLRTVSRQTVLGQFRRMAKGGDRMSPYDFSYTFPQPSGAKLQFSVDPVSPIPTNIHVVIGSNGAGKTSMLRNMCRAFVEQNASESETGALKIDVEHDSDEFASLVMVSFSAFDSFIDVESPTKKRVFRHLGLDVIRPSSEGPLERTQLTPNELAEKFAKSALICSRAPYQGRWLAAVSTLESDSTLAGIELSGLVNEPRDGFEGKAIALFNSLSAGHKIVLFAITRLVEVVEERTLVLFDEPESHLHPPLVSALVRAISEVMRDRNGVAILATHSPVVLQEVPRSCVWTIRRYGESIGVDRPTGETFGESVGILTREVFGLEVTKSGFFTLINDAAAQGMSYDALVRLWKGQLGSEAKSVALSLMRSHGNGGDD